MTQISHDEGGRRQDRAGRALGPAEGKLLRGDPGAKAVESPVSRGNGLVWIACGAQPLAFPF